MGATVLVEERIKPSLWKRAFVMQGSRAFRRCHICGTICESQKPVRRCTRCNKPFAPFYYFNDQYTPIQAEGGLRPPDMEGQWRPVQGLTAYWQSD